MVGWVKSKGRKYLQGRQQLGARLQKRRQKKKSLSSIQATEVELINVNLQVDENLLASLNFSGVRTSIASSANVVTRDKGDAQEKKCIGEALQDIEPFNTLSPL
jgi:hypothetical protein